MEYLLDFNGRSQDISRSSRPKPPPEEEKRPEFALPPANGDNRRVFAYLRKRGIAPQVIRSFLNAGLLYEDAKYHNCVFVGRDSAGRPKFASKMFSIIDSRYRSGKPLIVTTNLKLDELRHPPDLAHARIYDRILERCAPVLFAGKNFRENNAASTKAAARKIINNSKTL